MRAVTLPYISNRLTGTQISRKSSNFLIFFASVVPGAVLLIFRHQFAQTIFGLCHQKLYDLIEFRVEHSRERLRSSVYSMRAGFEWTGCSAAFLSAAPNMINFEGREMKTKRYAMLVLVLLASVLTMCLVGRAITKTQQFAKDIESDPLFKLAVDMLLSGKEPSEQAFRMLLMLRSKSTAEKRGTLIGLQGANVLIEVLKPEAQKYGLTREALKVAVESRLREHGIRWLSPSQSRFVPTLYVNVNMAVEESRGWVMVCVNVELHQQVVLLRDLKTSCTATTWNKSALTYGRVTNPRNITARVTEVVDVFINDYLAANPNMRFDIDKPRKEPEEPNKPIGFRPTEKNNNKPKDDAG